MEEIRINSELRNVDKDSVKVRLLSIKDGNLLVANYAGFYMLPGGKVDKDESLIDALKREVSEEVGISISDADIKELVCVDNYQTNYPSDGELISKHTKTYYYLLEDLLPDNVMSHLSDREMLYNFYLQTININDLVNELEKRCSNVKEIYFSRELLQVLEYYLKHYGLVDLHTHTNQSDGDKTPDELVTHAIDNNVKVLAITDHDTLKGIKMIDKDKYPDVEIINGIELSGKVIKGRLHILGYGIDLDNPELNLGVEKLRQNNIYTILELLRQLKLDYGIEFKEEDVLDLVNNTNNLGRPHVARLCIKYGLCETVQEAFDKYLEDAYEKLGDRKKGLPYKECLDLINGAGGIAVLAHPHTLKMDREELDNFVGELVDAGLRGIEVYHSNIKSDDRDFYLYLAEKYNLVLSGGTDYHGPSVKPDIKIGTGRNGNVYVPQDVSVLKLVRK